MKKRLRNTIKALCAEEGCSLKRKSRQQLVFLLKLYFSLPVERREIIIDIVDETLKARNEYA